MRSAGKKPNSTTSATPVRNRKADAFAAGLSGGRSAARIGTGIAPAFSRVWYSGSSFSSLPMNIETIAAATTPVSVAGTQTIRICGSPHCVTPFSAKRPIIAAVAAATGLAVIACCEAIVATAIGRSGRMPFWCAVS